MSKNLKTQQQKTQTIKNAGKGSAETETHTLLIRMQNVPITSIKIWNVYKITYT